MGGGCPGSKLPPARWAAVPDPRRAVPGPSDGHRFDIRQTPAVWFVALTLPMQQTARPSPRCNEQSGPLASSLSRALRVQGRVQVRARRSRGDSFGPLFAPRQQSPPGARSSSASPTAPGAPAPPAEGQRGHGCPGGSGGAPRPPRDGSRPRGLGGARPLAFTL